MAPTATANSSSPIPTSVQAAHDATDFINTLGTAIGPLLTLFGEQATKQFLSMSMGWADNILLATGPIGILTCIVSAIRIGGYRSLQALVGRARESRAVAEQEFLSSTSQETCELWSGREIVRVSGKPSEHGMKQLVIVGETTSEPGADKSELRDLKILDLAQAYAWVEVEPRVGNEELERFAMDAPNLALNVRGAIISAKELRIWAVVGILLQTFTLLFPALATYYSPWQWQRKGIAVPKYAYGSFVAGSIAIIVGMFLCGHVVEGSTREFTIKPKKDGAAGFRVQQVLCLQMASTVGSQRFPSYAILNGSEDKCIRVSRLDDTKEYYKTLSAVGAFLAFSGFVVQFVGLSALHWSATILVLGVSLIMTVLRAWIRRGVANDPRSIPIPENFELAWLALRMVKNDWDDFVASERSGIPSPIWRDCGWGILTGFLEPDGISALSDSAKDYVQPLNQYSDTKFAVGFWCFTTTESSPAINAAEHLVSISPNIPLGSCVEVASRLAAAMGRIMKILDSDVLVRWKENQAPWAECYWQIDVQEKLGAKSAWVVRMNEGEAALSQDLTAGLSLWLYSLIRAKKSLDVALGSSDPLEIRSIALEESTSFPRIIANTGFISVKDLTAWCPQTEFFTTHSYDGKDYEDFNGGTIRYTPAWPVFGLYHSAAFEKEDISYGGYHHTSAFQFTNGMSSPGDKNEDIMLDVPGWRSIEEECAQELFSLFMLSICMRVERVEGRTRQSRDKISNTVFDALAKATVDAELMIFPSEALLLIIPAFARFGLLPSVEEELPSVEEELLSVEEELLSVEEELPSVEEELPSVEEELPSVKEEHSGGSSGTVGPG